jgi:hypothetical protein
LFDGVCGRIPARESGELLGMRRKHNHQSPQIQFDVWRRMTAPASSGCIIKQNNAKRTSARAGRMKADTQYESKQSGKKKKKKKIKRYLSESPNHLMQNTILNQFKTTPYHDLSKNPIKNCSPSAPIHDDS